jgi:hypothetical protein
MAITFQQLQEMVTRQKLRFYVSNDDTILRFSITGLFGAYEIAICLQDNGAFLQFRTFNYHTCTKGHPHLLPVLQTIGQINFARRLVKLGWDPNDGEIMAYADTWIADSGLTDDQLRHMLGNFLTAIDVAHSRLAKTIETGTDPGDPDPAELKARIAAGPPGGPGPTGGGGGGGGTSKSKPDADLKSGDPPAPSALKGLLDRLRGGDKPKDPPPTGDKITEV